MREIRFRGKRVDNNEWVYGYYVHTEHLGVGAHIFKNMIEKVQVIPETVGQFTEYVDRNGNSIFEGDILERKWKSFSPPHERITLRTIIFSHGCFMTDHETVLMTERHVGVMELDYDIIGNIHE